MNFRKDKNQRIWELGLILIMGALGLAVANYVARVDGLGMEFEMIIFLSVSVALVVAGMFVWSYVKSNPRHGAYSKD